MGIFSIQTSSFTFEILFTFHIHNNIPHFVHFFWLRFTEIQLIKCLPVLHSLFHTFRKLIFLALTSNNQRILTVFNQAVKNI